MNQAGQFDNCNKVSAVTIGNVIQHETHILIDTFDTQKL